MKFVLATLFVLVFIYCSNAIQFRRAPRSFRRDLDHRTFRHNPLNRRVHHRKDTLDNLDPLEKQKLPKLKEEKRNGFKPVDHGKRTPPYGQRPHDHQKPTRPNDNPKVCKDNVIVKWAHVYLRIFRDTFGFLSPPMTSRAIYMITASMYDSMSAYKPNLKPVVCRIEKKSQEENTEANVIIAASNAALTVIQSIFRNHRDQLDEAYALMDEIQSSYRSTGSAESVGSHCGQEMIESRKDDGSNEFGDEPSTKDNQVYSDYTNYYPVNPNQTRVGMTDCRNVRSKNHWTPLLVPTPNGAPKVQIALSPHMPNVKAFAASLDLMKTVKPPPQLGTNTERQYHDDVQQILDIYEKLTDEQKVIAEYWADGPLSALPPGHWHIISLFMINKKCLSIEDSIKLLFLQSAAALDSGILTWAVKRYYDFIRPVTAIHCSKYENQTINSYKGPYLGIGPILGKHFQPYQNVFFVTPPFQEYCSGHSAFSSASAEVLKSFFGSDEYGEVVVIKQGESLFEPKIERGEAGFIDGLTNVPNSGPHSVGYSPAKDISLSWKTFSDAADESGISRLFGGIHFKSGDLNCRKLGRDVGKVVYQRYKSLTN